MDFKNIFLCLLLCFFSSVSFAAGGKVFNKDYSKIKSLKAVIHVHEGKIVGETKRGSSDFSPEHVGALMIGAYEKEEKHEA